MGFLHVGWAKKMHNMDKNAINEPDSVFLHVANGKIYLNGTAHDYCGVKIRSGQVVGAYINRNTAQAWFEIDGHSCGIAVKQVSLGFGRWYPTVSSAIMGSRF